LTAALTTTTTPAFLLSILKFVLLIMSADAIDALLDELDEDNNSPVTTAAATHSAPLRSSAGAPPAPGSSGLSRQQPQTAPSTAMPAPATTPAGGGAAPLNDSLDALLGEFGDDEDLGSRGGAASSNTAGAAGAAGVSSAPMASAGSDGGGTTQCVYPHVCGGGGSATCGPTLSLARPATCDRLRCTACDLEVMHLPGVRWPEGAVSYLFLRNNYPDTVALRAAGVPDRDSQCHACQCKWVVTGRGESVRVGDGGTGPSSWFCGGGHRP
jgi:hypothetical protein